MLTKTKSIAVRQSTWTVAAVLTWATVSGVCSGQGKPAVASTENANLYDAFAVARSGPDNNGAGFRVRANNDLEAVNTTLLEIVAFAYNVHPKHIVNAPAWASDTHFDLKLHYRRIGVPEDAACKEMLKQALKEHFGLVLHSGGQDVPSFAIHVEPAGAKLAQSLEMPGTLPALAMPEPGKLHAHNVTVADLAATLQRSVVDRPVVDESGVKGRWDFDLTWAPAPTEYSGQFAAAAPAPSQGLAEAMKRELGLRLDPVTAPPSDLILDHVQMPESL